MSESQTRFNTQNIKNAKSQVCRIYGLPTQAELDGLLVYGVSQWSDKMEQFRKTTALSQAKKINQETFISDNFPRSKRPGAPDRLQNFKRYRAKRSLSVSDEYLSAFIDACVNIFPEVFKNKHVIDCIAELALLSPTQVTVSPHTEMPPLGKKTISALSQVYISPTDDMYSHRNKALAAVEVNKLRPVERNVQLGESDDAFKKIFFDLHNYSDAFVALIGLDYGDSYPCGDSSWSYVHYEVMEAVNKFVEQGQMAPSSKTATPIRLILPAADSTLLIRLEAQAASVSSENRSKIQDFIYELEHRIKNLVDSQDIILRVNNEDMITAQLSLELNTLKASAVVDPHYATEAEAIYSRDKQQYQSNSKISTLRALPVWQRLEALYSAFETQAKTNISPLFCLLTCSESIDSLTLFSDTLVKEGLWPSESTQELVFNRKQAINSQRIWQALWSTAGCDSYRDQSPDGLAKAIISCGRPLQLIIRNIEYVDIDRFLDDIWQPLARCVDRMIKAGELTLNQTHVFNLVLTYRIVGKQSRRDIAKYPVTNPSSKNNFSQLVVVDELPLI